MPNDPKVLAICVNWNGGAVLAETLDALKAGNYPNLEIVVADNASEDGSVEIARRRGVRTVRNAQNLGYGAAINKAIADAATSPGEAPVFFLALNNDVTLAKDALSSLVETAQRRGPGVYGPMILRADRPGHLEAAWGRMTFSHVLCHFEGENQPEHIAGENVRRVQLLLGSVLLIHRDVLEKIGGFDPRFFMYHEEIDFLYRLNRAGLPAYFCPAARAVHIGGHSTRSQPLLKTYWIRKNTVLFLRKHRPGTTQWLTWAATLLPSLAFNLVRFRWRRLRSIARGVRDGFREGKASRPE